MFSLTKTGMNFFPLCTARVTPTNSGRMVDLRDQVFITLRSPTFLALVILSSSVHLQMALFLKTEALYPPVSLLFGHTLDFSVGNRRAGANSYFRR